MFVKKYSRLWIVLELLYVNNSVPRMEGLYSWWEGLCISCSWLIFFEFIFDLWSVCAKWSLWIQSEWWCFEYLKYLDFGAWTILSSLETNEDCCYVLLSLSLSKQSICTCLELQHTGQLETHPQAHANTEHEDFLKICDDVAPKTVAVIILVPETRILYLSMMQTGKG